MKKTLITLAALAASVVQAATLDFTAPDTLPTTVTFAGDATDILTLNANVTVNDSVITYGDKTITIADNKTLFNQHGNTTIGALNGATLNFGSDGKLTVTQNKQINLYGQNLKLTGELDFTVETDDASLVGKTVIQYRTLIDGTDTSDWGTWNVTDNNGVVSASFTAVSGSAVSASWAGMDKSETDILAAGAGAYTINRWYDDADVVVRYAATYVAAAPVPEPTTATLSLLALAGLAARRRRK